MGRELFGEGLKFSTLREMYQSGATFKSTRLSDSFTYQQFQDQYTTQVHLLCVVTEGSRILVNTVDAPLSPTVGQTIVTLVSTVSVPENHAGQAPKLA